MRVQRTEQEILDGLFLIYFYRNHIDIAVRDIFGLDLCPHHNLILRNWNKGKETNDWLGSRGMGKTVLMAMYLLIHCLLYPNNKILVVGGGGMRQSKFVVWECEKIILGRLSGQKQLNYARACLENPQKVITHNPSEWKISFKNGSEIMAVPLGKTGDLIKGIRAYKTLKDECFLITREIDQAILEPMRNVLANPLGGKKEIQSIKLQDFNTSTIDYTFRYFYQLFLSHLQELEVGNKNRTVFEFNFEDAFDPDENEGVKELWWGVNAERLLEKKNDPMTDMSIWNAENKNIPMDISGGYFDSQDIQKCTEYCIDESQDLYLTPLLSSCSPCILSIDSAAQEANTAFIIIKMGEKYNQTNFKHCSKIDYFALEKNSSRCPFYNESKRCCKLQDTTVVIYAYEENKMKLRDRVKLVYELMEKFNLFSISMDARGGGFELANMLGDPEMVRDIMGQGYKCLYDPIMNPRGEGTPILTLYATDNKFNTENNAYLRTLLSSQQLFLPRPIRDVNDKRLAMIHEAVKNLISQLLRIKAKPSGGWLSFDIEQVSSGTKYRRPRKDLYSALVYGIAKLREIRELEKNQFKSLIDQIGMPMWTGKR